MHKFIKAAAAAVIITALTLTAGCFPRVSKPTVNLSVWWSDENDRELINAEIEKFKEKYSDEAQLEITISTENVLTVRNTVLARPQSAADVYMFADDQFDDLCRAGLVSKTHRWRENGSYSSNLYQLL